MGSRYFNTDFWSDPWVHGLKVSERDLFMYLLTNDKANIAGVYEIAFDRIAFDTGLKPKAINEALETFKKAGKAFYLEGWVVMRNAPKHQSLTSDKTVKGIRRVLESVPASVEALLYEVRYQLEPYKEGPCKDHEGAYKDHEGAYKGLISGKKGHPYFTLLNASGGGPVPPAAAGAESIFRDFNELIKERDNDTKAHD